MCGQFLSNLIRGFQEGFLSSGQTGLGGARPAGHYAVISKSMPSASLSERYRNWQSKGQLVLTV
jgi:hypothetical protein